MAAAEETAPFAAAMAAKAASAATPSSHGAMPIENGNSDSSSTSSSSSNSSSTPSKSKRKFGVLRVGGVPEHFNYPWKIAQDRHLFDKHEVQVDWVEQKLGTGQMITNLKDGVVDVVVALTEGLIADIAQGSDIRLMGTYVESPLCWGITVGAESPHQTIEDLRGRTFGISRFTSGSHLMSYVLASQRGWDPTTDVKFEVKGSFENLRKGTNDGSCDAFLWEHFTTKPFWDSGECRTVGDIETPWPCFMIAARKAFIDDHLEIIKSMLAAIREACQIFRAEVGMPAQIAKFANLKQEDAEKWYEGVRISACAEISEAALERTVETLIETKVLKKDLYVDLEKLFDHRVARLTRDIKSMRLYNKPELVTSVYNSLRSIGKSKGPLSYKDLLPFDQHHYHGTPAVDDVVSALHIDQSKRVVNIGSGMGGPARYMAGQYGCQVLAVELQEDLSRTASELTARCGLSEQVHHAAGDFLQLAQHMQQNAYDAAVSWLTILHITDREALFRSSANILKEGGWFFAADFYELHPFTPQEKKALAQDVYCRYLPTLEQYKKDVMEAGLELVSVEEMTDDWRKWARARVESLENDKEKIVKVQGEDIWKRLQFFYTVIAELFEGGNLGGVHVIARKPQPDYSKKGKRSTSVSN